MQLDSRNKSRKRPSSLLSFRCPNSNFSYRKILFLVVVYGVTLLLSVSGLDVLEVETNADLSNIIERYTERNNSNISGAVASIGEQYNILASSNKNNSGVWSETNLEEAATDSVAKQNRRERIARQFQKLTEHQQYGEIFGSQSTIDADRIRSTIPTPPGSSSGMESSGTKVEPNIQDRSSTENKAQTSSGSRRQPTESTSLSLLNALTLQHSEKFVDKTKSKNYVVRSFIAPRKLRQWDDQNLPGTFSKSQDIPNRHPSAFSNDHPTAFSNDLPMFQPTAPPTSSAKPPGPTPTFEPPAPEPPSPEPPAPEPDTLPPKTLPPFTLPPMGAPTRLPIITRRPTSSPTKSPSRSPTKGPPEPGSPTVQEPGGGGNSPDEPNGPIAEPGVGTDKPSTSPTASPTGKASPDPTPPRSSTQPSTVPEPGEPESTPSPVGEPDGGGNEPGEPGGGDNEPGDPGGGNEPGEPGGGDSEPQSTTTAPTITYKPTFTNSPTDGTIEPGGNEPGGNEPGGNEPGGDEPGGDEPGGDEPGGDEPGGNEPGGNEPGGNEPGGVGDEPNEPGEGVNDPGEPANLPGELGGSNEETLSMLDFSTAMPTFVPTFFPTFWPTSFSLANGFGGERTAKPVSISMAASKVVENESGTISIAALEADKGGERVSIAEVPPYELQFAVLSGTKKSFPSLDDIGVLELLTSEYILTYSESLLGSYLLTHDGLELKHIEVTGEVSKQSRKLLESSDKLSHHSSEPDVLQQHFSFTFHSKFEFMHRTKATWALDLQGLAENLVKTSLSEKGNKGYLNIIQETSSFDNEDGVEEGFFFAATTSIMLDRASVTTDKTHVKKEEKDISPFFKPKFIALLACALISLGLTIALCLGCRIQRKRKRWLKTKTNIRDGDDEVTLVFSDNIDSNGVGGGEEDYTEEPKLDMLHEDLKWGLDDLIYGNDDSDEDKDFERIEPARKSDRRSVVEVSESSREGASEEASEPYENFRREALERVKENVSNSTQKR